MRGEHSFAVPTKFFALLCAMLGIFLVKNILFTTVLVIFCFVYVGFQRNYRLMTSCGAFYLLLSLLLYAIPFWGYGHYFRIPCVVFLEQYGNAHAVLGFVYDASWRTVVVLVKYPHAHWRHIGTDGHISIFPHHEG